VQGCCVICVENPNCKEIRVISQLNNRSLVAVVTIERPRCLQIYHCRKGVEICSYNYQNTILGIKISSDVSVHYTLHLLFPASSVNVMLRNVCEVSITHQKNRSLT
jgi:hypothetical protein